MVRIGNVYWNGRRFRHSICAWYAEIGFYPGRRLANRKLQNKWNVSNTQSAKSSCSPRAGKCVCRLLRGIFYWLDPFISVTVSKAQSSRYILFAFSYVLAYVPHSSRETVVSFNFEHSLRPCVYIFVVPVRFSCLFGIAFFPFHRHRSNRVSVLYYNAPYTNMILSTFRCVYITCICRRTSAALICCVSDTKCGEVTWAHV